MPLSPGTRLYTLFHALWTKAIDAPGYSREDWHELSGLLETPTRKINGMFHVDSEGFLVKTSNGQRVPEDEPVFILRGRDALAAQTIHHYVGLMIANNGEPMRMYELGGVVHDFLKFKDTYPERMKQPGSTMGK